jgi:hypothetical protein
MQQENSGPRNWPAGPLVVFALLILLRLALSSRLPSYILADMPHDDAWVVFRAISILKGHWLGTYDQFTLIKGPFSPLLMAFSSGVGVTFRGLNTALYCAACVIFILALRPVLKNNWLALFVLAVVLFNPLPYALETGQRIYRNGIGQWQILLLLSCLIALFLRRNEDRRVILRWALGAGFTLGALLETREDTGWIYPFVLGSIAVTCLFFLLEKQGARKHIAIFLIPIVFPFAFNSTVRAMNYLHYGMAITNDRNGGNYAKVASDLLAITPDAADDALYGSQIEQGRYYNIYVSTMEKAFAASPTLKGVSPSIRDAIRTWASWQEVKNGELGTDHMLFALRDGVKAAGYYKTLRETEAFYGKVHDELQKAFENGTLVSRGFSVSPLIKRIQWPDITRAMSIMPRAIREVAGFEGVHAQSIPAAGSPKGISTFVQIAGGDYYSLGNFIQSAGWAFAEDSNTRLSAAVYDDQGTQLMSVPFQPAKDVFDLYNNPNAKLSRFSFKIDGYDLKSGVSLRFLDQNGAVVWELPLDGTEGCGAREGVFRYCMDMSMGDSSGDHFAPLVARANLVIDVYKTVTPIASILACLVYLAATIKLVGELRRKNYKDTLPVWLILTGLGLTFMLFVSAMSLITATSFHALSYIYTAPAYLLLLVFCSISVVWGFESVKEYRKHRHS